MVGYIYLITDLLTGKQYTGKHHYDKPELDPNYHGSGIIISKIYNKRPETLKEEYIKTCYSEEELNEWEKYFIFVFNTLHPNGYNLTEGGEGCVACEETRKKISEKLKGRPSPMKGKHIEDETRKKISEKLKGEKSPIFGKHRSDEIRKKISESLKGRHQLEETKKKIGETLMNGKCSKVVLQFTLDGEFVREWSSVMECGRNGFQYPNVSACCRGKLKSHKGYVWRYKESN